MYSDTGDLVDRLIDILIDIMYFQREAYINRKVEGYEGTIATITAHMRNGYIMLVTYIHNLHNDRT